MRALLMTAKKKGGWQPNPSRTLFYYEFENNLNDSSGNNNNITGSQGVGYDQIGGQYVANLTNGTGYIKIPSIQNSIGTGDFTVSFRLYPKQPGAYSGYNSYPMMFLMCVDTYPYPGPTIFFDPLNRNGLGDKLLWRTSSNNQTASTITASSLYDGWHHFVMTRNSGTTKCYIDGQQDATWSSDTTLFPTTNESDYRGYALFGVNGNWQSWRNTGIKGDKVILENKAWTAQEILDYYNSTKDNYPVYEYSYTFQGKTTAEIQQEFSILTGTLQVNSDGVTGSSSTDCRIKKDIPSLASATKIEITATTVVNSNRPTHNASYAGIGTGSGWGTGQAIYCVEGSGYNGLYVYFGSLGNVVGTAGIGTYTPTITIDLENKEIIGTLSGYSNSTKTLSDADVATIRAFTYLVVYVSTNNSAVSDVNIKIYGSIPNNLLNNNLNNNLSLNQNINQNNNLENNLHVRPPVNNGSGDLQK